MKKITFLFVCSLIVSFNSAYCEPETPYELDTPPSEVVETPAKSNSSVKDSITLSSAYFESQYTNKQLANLGLEAIRWMARLEDFLASNFDNEERNAARWCARALYILFIHRAFNTAYHEIGHGLRAKAYGNDFQLTEHNDNGDFKKDQNFFKFFVKKMGNFSRALCRYKKGLKDEEELVIAAGGMNNETYIAERISRDFHDRGRLSFAESFAYFYGKLSPVAYALSKNSKNEEADALSGDDPVAVGGFYKRLGISATKNDIALGGLVSTLLSGTTYSIIKSAFSPNEYATPISFYNFQAPDMFSYVTSKGISYRLTSAYKYQDDLKFLFGAEHVFHGKSTTEIHLGVDTTLDSSFYNTNLKVVTTFCNGFNLETACSVPVMDCLSINVEAGTYSCKSMLGERHSKNMKDGKGRSTDISVSISYRY